MLVFILSPILGDGPVHLVLCLWPTAFVLSLYFWGAFIYSVSKCLMPKLWGGQMFELQEHSEWGPPRYQDSSISSYSHPSQTGLLHVSETWPSAPSHQHKMALKCSVFQVWKPGEGPWVHLGSDAQTWTGQGAPLWPCSQEKGSWLLVEWSHWRWWHPLTRLCSWTCRDCSRCSQPREREKQAVKNQQDSGGSVPGGEWRGYPRGRGIQLSIMKQGWRWNESNARILRSSQRERWGWAVEARACSSGKFRTFCLIGSWGPRTVCLFRHLLTPSGTWGHEQVTRSRSVHTETLKCFSLYSFVVLGTKKKNAF